MSNLVNAYGYTGNFVAERWYTILFNEIPCTYMVAFEDPTQLLDEKSITFDRCKHLFDHPDAIRQLVGETRGSQDKEGDDLDLYAVDTVLIKRDRARSALIIVQDHVMYDIYDDGYTVFYNIENDLDSIKDFVAKVWGCFPKVKTEEKSAKVGLIKYSQGEYYTTFSSIKHTNINIEENYNDDFIPVYKDIVEFLNQRESGLVLAYGKFGTGKTNLIRHLCSNILKDYVIVPNSVASRLGDPDFISYITSCKDYVFILEDCEQLLIDRQENPWNNAITTILNMADGLLSDVVNIKFICTFNTAIENIDPALLRKGRCFAKYEFKELAEEKVERLNEKYNLGLKEIKPMTLAEIYNSERTDYSETESKPRKIGF